MRSQGGDFNATCTTGKRVDSAVFTDLGTDQGLSMLFAPKLKPPLDKVKKATESSEVRFPKVPKGTPDTGAGRSNGHKAVCTFNSNGFS